LHDFREDRGIVYGQHFAPHDARNRSFSTGKSVIDTANELGFQFEVIPRTQDKMGAIENARQTFSTMWFHEDNCRHGLSCLREYHARYNEASGAMGGPEHNWASNGADAFLAIGQAIDGNLHETSNGRVIMNRVGNASML